MQAVWPNRLITAIIAIKWVQRPELEITLPVVNNRQMDKDKRTEPPPWQNNKNSTTSEEALLKKEPSRFLTSECLVTQKINKFTPTSGCSQLHKANKQAIEHDALEQFSYRKIFPVKQRLQDQGRTFRKGITSDREGARCTSLN